MELNDISGSIKTTKKQTVSNPIEHVVSSELRDAITEINTIVKSNAYYGELRCCDGELHRLISLCEIAQSELSNSC